MTDTKKKIFGIILAAGTGSRMGQTKQLLPYGATTLLGQVVQAAKTSDLDKIIVVLGYQAGRIERKTGLCETQVVINPEYAKGQSTSLRAGLSATQGDCSAAMILLADQPLIDHQIINTLIGTWRQSTRPILIPYCSGKRGNPVIIGASLFKAVCAIKGDRGARALFDEHQEQIEKVEIRNPAILTDVDTKEAYERLLSDK